MTTIYSDSLHNKPTETPQRPLWLMQAWLEPRFVVVTLAAIFLSLAAERVGTSAFVIALLGVIAYVAGGVYGLKGAIENLRHHRLDLDLLIHHSDQGLHYACVDYNDRLREEHAQISMAAASKPEDNGFAERLMRTIKEEEVNLSAYTDFHDAYQRIGRFLDDVYTRKRIQSALAYLTPTEFEAQWRAQQQRALVS